MYIGEKKIKGVLDLPEGEVKVMFKDGEDITINKNLLDIIQSEDKRQGGVTDAVRMVLATKFLQECADYGLEFYMLGHIGQGMETLAHNLREEAFGKAFDCQGLNGIKISKLLNEKEV